MNDLTFENYLMGIFEKDYHGVKDDAFDAFNVWVERMDTSEILQHGEDYGAMLAKRLVQTIAIAENAVMELKKIRAMAMR